MKESESEKPLNGSLLDAVWFYFSLLFKFLAFCLEHPILAFTGFVGTRRIGNVKWTYKVCFGSVRSLTPWSGFYGGSVFRFGEKNKVEVYAIIQGAERLPLLDWSDPKQRIVMPAFIGSVVVRGIAERLFYNQDMLRSIELPSSLVEIGTAAFQGCSSLERVEIEWNTKYNFIVRAGAFSGCSSLKEFVVEKSADSLVDTDEHSGCFTIMARVFNNCTTLAKVELIPNVSIWCNAFDGCSRMEDIVLPSGVSLGRDAFAICQNLHSITMDEEDFISLKKSTQDDIECENRLNKEPQPTDDQILKFLGAPASCRLVVRSKGDSRSRP